MLRIIDDEEEDEPYIKPIVEFNTRFPFCKDICTCKRFATKKVTLPLYDPKSGIRTFKQNALKIFVNRPILLRGFGIYGTITQTSMTVTFGVYTKDYCDAENLVEAKRFLQFSGHRQIYPILFKKPLYLNCFNKYIIYLNVNSHLTYSGVQGRDRVLCDKITFMFLNIDDWSSLTTVKSGNFPEIYYSIPKEETTTCNLSRNLTIDYIVEETRPKKYTKRCRLTKKPIKKEYIKKIKMELEKDKNAEGTENEAENPDYV